MKRPLRELEAELDSLKLPAQREAQELFPSHPSAQVVWVKLKTGDGGISDVVETLSLQSEYDDYSEQFDQYCKKEMFEVAGLHLNGFVNYCLEMVEENFYLFK